jgi:hypothetical protein
VPPVRLLVPEEVAVEEETATAAMPRRMITTSMTYPHLSLPRSGVVKRLLPLPGRSTMVWSSRSRSHFHPPLFPEDAVWVVVMQEVPVYVISTVIFEPDTLIVPDVGVKNSALGLTV